MEICTPYTSSNMLLLSYVQSVRIGAEEEIDDTKGLKPEEIEEMMREREAKAKAQILEMVYIFLIFCSYVFDSLPC
jgi:hypothetical protein